MFSGKTLMFTSPFCELEYLLIDAENKAYLIEDDCLDLRKSSSY